MKKTIKLQKPARRKTTKGEPLAKEFTRTPHSGGKGEIRIIGGDWKRSLLPVPDLPGLRPTPDRVRETLFNWLGQDLTGWRCADVFGGCGALGFEAASRGAAYVLIVENSAALQRPLQTTKERLNATTVTIERGDGVAALRRCAPASLDLVLLDPPFDSLLYESALQAAAVAIRPEAFVYLEAPIVWTDEQLAPLGFTRHRYLKAGVVHAHLLQPLHSAA
jgi:16S rRNA (guanine966-N2)-methyltransferase